MKCSTTYSGRLGVGTGIRCMFSMLSSFSESLPNGFVEILLIPNEAYAGRERNERNSEIIVIS